MLVQLQSMALLKPTHVQHSQIVYNTVITATPLQFHALHTGREYATRARKLSQYNLQHICNTLMTLKSGELCSQHRTQFRQQYQLSIPTHQASYLDALHETSGI